MVLESLLCQRSLFCSNNIHPFCSRQICTTGQEYLAVYWSRISVLDITKCQLPWLVTNNICKEIDRVREPRVSIHNSSRPKCNSSKTIKPGKKITWTIKVVSSCFLLAVWPLLYFNSWRGKIILETQTIPLGPSQTSHFKLLPPNNPDWMDDGWQDQEGPHNLTYWCDVGELFW